MQHSQNNTGDKDYSASKHFNLFCLESFLWPGYSGGMSREWDNYRLTCRACGAVGTVRIWSDDWNRWGAEWAGFSGKVYVTGPVADYIKCDACGEYAAVILPER